MDIDEPAPRQPPVPSTTCVRCHQSNTYCALSYPWYMRENPAWRKDVKTKKEVCVLCCQCTFKVAYKGRADLPPCHCEGVFYGEAKK